VTPPTGTSSTHQSSETYSERKAFLRHVLDQYDERGHLGDLARQLYKAMPGAYAYQLFRERRASTWPLLIARYGLRLNECLLMTEFEKWRGGPR
jgi:hypothetical protein